MKKIIFFLFFLLVLNISNSAFAGLFSNGESTKVKEGDQEKGSIPIFLDADKLIKKRQEEARKLITEGIKLIKRGKTKNDKDLVTKGQIKKEIGEKQLELLKEQSTQREREHSGEW